MKVYVSLAISFLTASLLLSFLPVRGETEIYDSVIRLHVLAVSDGEEDQEIKLAVRDRVLQDLTPLLQPAETMEEAADILRKNLDSLENRTAVWMGEQGIRTPVQFTFTREAYPTRTYDDFMLPAGEYLSLRVVLGDGEGKNWWCVLFPSVCSRFAMPDTEENFRAAGFTPEQYRMITHSGEGVYKIRFRLLEILSEWLR
ncbi:MAG: stage II sporulation protein R [Clostridia bacterium]|nr:stage II sporulation protein R [Clostridia bacterium]